MNNKEHLINTGTHKKNGISLLEDDWSEMQETMYINSISGVTEKFVTGRKSSLDIYLSHPGW